MEILVPIRLGLAGHEGLARGGGCVAKGAKDRWRNASSISDCFGLETDIRGYGFLTRYKLTLSLGVKSHVDLQVRLVKWSGCI